MSYDAVQLRRNLRLAADSVRLQNEPSNPVSLYKSKNPHHGNRSFYDPAFIPLIGEPIVFRYEDANGNVQLILAIGKKAGHSLNEREYHVIDTADLDEKIAAEVAAREALDTETIKRIIFDGVESEFADNVATLSVSANSIPVGADYENHVRKAIHFRALKGTSYEIDFGYNFDFIQIIKSEKLQYNRTEKCVILHIRDVPYPYAADTDKELWDCSYQIERYFKDKNQGIQHTRTVLNNVIPIIYNYFLQIQTYDDMINEIDRRISLDNPIYYMIYPDQQYIQIWLTAKKGEKDKAFQLLNEYPYLSEESKNMIMTKLKSL